MPIRTNVSIWDTAGDQRDRIANAFVAEAYDQQSSQRRTITGSTTRFEIDFGPVTTAKFIYIKTDQDIAVYLSNSLVLVNVTDIFLVIGCEETALHIVAASDTNLVIYIAGD